jgi:hypothetical protein
MPDYSMPFNPNIMSLNDLASLSPMKDTAMGLLGAGLPGGMRNDIMSQLPMGMMNRDGQQFMGQQQPQMQQPAPQDGMSRGDMMKLAGMAMQGFNRGQQAPQAPTQQIIRDSNQFRFAGNPQQQMAQALRNR